MESTASTFDAVETVDVAQDQRAAGYGGRGPEHAFEAVFAQHFEVRAGLKHVRRPAFIQTKDFAVRGPWRGPETARARNPLVIKLLAGLGVVASHQAAVLMQDVEMVLVNQRRGHLRAALGVGPGDAVVGGFAFFERDIACGAGFDGVETATAATATASEASSATGATRAPRLAATLGAAWLVSASRASGTAGHSTAAHAKAGLGADVEPFTIGDRRGVTS